MSDTLPKLRAPSRLGARKGPALPDVKAVMAARAALVEPRATAPSNIVFWPSPQKSVTPTPAVSSSLIDDLGRAPQAHVKLQQLVSNGLKSLRLEFPSHRIPDVQWSQPFDDDHVLDVNLDAAISPLERHQPDRHNIAPHNAARIRDVIAKRHAELGITTSDALTEEEDVLIARFDIIHQAMRSFASIFKGHRPFLERVAEEAIQFAQGMHSIMRRRVADSIQRTREFEEAYATFKQVETSLKSTIASLEAQVTSLSAAEKARVEVDKSGERRANVLEALLAEKTADLRDRDEVVAIQTRKLFEQEKRIEQLDLELSAAASNNISLQKQLASRQQVIEKLNFSNEQLYQDRAALQRQLVQIAKKAGDVGPSARRQSRRMSMTSATAQLAGLESFFTVQTRCMEELMLLTTKSFTEAVHKGYWTPRPTTQQISVDGNAAVSSTAARFADMQHRIRQLSGELGDLRTELDEALTLHDCITHDRTARFTVPGVIQTLGTAYFPTAAERTLLGPKWFLTLGDDPHVPEHLRAQTGKVRNLRLNRHRVLNHATNFLRWLTGKYSRSEVVQVGASAAWYSSRLAEWIFETFAPEEAVSVSYSLDDGLRCFAYEGRCGFVYELVHGLVSFDVWLAIEDWIERVRDLLLRSGREVDARLTKKQALAIIERAFYVLPNDEIARVMAALSKDHSGDGLNVTSLFAVDAKGNEKQLPLMIREVLLRDRLALVKDVQTAIMDDSSTSGGHATPHAVASAVLRVDPRRPEHQIDALLVHVFGPSMEQTLSVADRLTPLSERFVFSGEVVPLHTALERIRHVLFGRWSKRREQDDTSGPSDTSVNNIVM